MINRHQRHLIINRFFACILILGCSQNLFAQTNFDEAPINYSTSEFSDPVAKLMAQTSYQDHGWEFDKQTGYLQSLLNKLQIPLSSQTLVFSKTSLQLHRISPRHPRAIYFNDEVYVGFCQNGDTLEIAATDPVQGAVFYTLDQNRTERPQLKRDNGSCLACHANQRTQNVPGFVVRSVYPDRSGQPLFSRGTFTSDSNSPFHERWGGWYVTGTTGTMKHMGNQVYSENQSAPSAIVGDSADSDAHIISGEAAIHRYLTPHSDVVALMVLEHQTQMHNTLTAASYETRQAIFQSQQMNQVLDRPDGYLTDSAKRRIHSAAERIVAKLLFKNEFQLTDQVVGTSGYTQTFEATGPFDSHARSLRQFDLKTRMFRYPCSYLIYSPAFEQLPKELKSQVTERLLAVLTNRDATGDYEYLDKQLRREIWELIMETKPEILLNEEASNG